ncbi:hypothetical protein UFOVP1146_249 [uncultured Caudovirales phage]|uniref:Uncharacterized protein n=1 Tax=uncultured Caudovirales phage TaxID=2100421 RepID=A0A6J5P3J3_9CAUD|nr:hypothetical protein UFOVP812_162 [uncultured Caudovirales phage]CAB4165867.1 hypothetical protein UFOVP818_403 [uncultured Caudovirales phage]CAB4186903.1 hypothetical protein UFOVP1146_249 [uncultured Caudovirales phage]CAB4221429.1 hypothetical protein UFOVP1638_316 [uncultured Caudovirales phage]
MAKLQSTTLAITISKLCKDSDTPIELLTAETLEQIEAVVAQLVHESGAGTVVIESKISTE